jgi:hypothetical protein
MADRTKFRQGSTQQVDDDVRIPDNETIVGGLFFTADQVELVTTTKTLDAGDSGVIQRVTATTTITLPATAIGLCYIIENGGEDGTVTVTVSPNASDMIVGNGFTGADNKDAINTLGNKGDRLMLIGDGTTAVGWNCASVRGTWTREA